MKKSLLLFALFVLTFAAHAQVNLYEHCNFDGYSTTLSEIGYYNIDEFGLDNDVVSSVTTEVGWSITLFEHSNFQGRSWTFFNRGESSCLTNQTIGSFNFNDQTSSVLVAKTVSLFQDCSFSGTEQVIWVGDWNLDGLTTIGNDQLSSLIIPYGMEVTLYEHTHFQGESITLRSDSECLVSLGWNDRVSSLKVRIN